MAAERVCEAVVFVVALRAVLGLVGVPSDRGGQAVVAAVRRRPLPVVSIAITAALVAGAVTELVRPSALATLAQSPDGPWWQALTAPFVQGNGLAGTVFNVVSAAIVLALAEWYWGRVAAAGVWLVGAWAPLGTLAGLIGYRVAPENVVAYSSGSSGATYFAVGALCAAAVLLAGRAARLAGACTGVIAVLMWVVLDDGHGVVLIEGAVLGLLLVGVRVSRRAVRESGSPTTTRKVGTMSGSDFARKPDEENPAGASEGDGVTEGLSNPDLHGAARDVAQHADDSEGDDAAKTAGG